MTTCQKNTELSSWLTHTVEMDAQNAQLNAWIQLCKKEQTRSSSQKKIMFQERKNIQWSIILEKKNSSKLETRKLRLWSSISSTYKTRIFCFGKGLDSEFVEERLFADEVSGWVSTQHSMLKLLKCSLIPLQLKPPPQFQVCAVRCAPHVQRWRIYRITEHIVLFEMLYDTFLKGYIRK